MKLKEYALSIKDKLNKDNIFVYNEEINGEKYHLLDLFKANRKNNKYAQRLSKIRGREKTEDEEVYVYFTSMFTDPIEEISSYWQEKDVNPDWFVEMTRDEWEDFITEEIRKNVEIWKNKYPDKFNSYKEDIKRDGCKIHYQKYNKTYWALVGVASSDEDYYWVLIDRTGKFLFSSCVGYVDFINEEDDVTGYEYKLLKEYLNENVDEIKDKLKNMKQMVIFYDIFNKD